MSEKITQFRILLIILLFFFFLSIYLFLYYRFRSNVYNLARMIKTNKTNVTLATALPSGNYHKTGIAIGQFQDEINTRLNVVLKPSNGSVDNIEKLLNEEIHFAFVQEDVAKEYLKDPRSKNLRFVCALFDEMITGISKKESHIAKITDISNDRYSNPDTLEYLTNDEFSNLDNKLIENYQTDLSCFRESSALQRKRVCGPYSPEMILKASDFNLNPPKPERKENQFDLSLNVQGSGSRFNADMIIQDITNYNDLKLNNDDSIKDMENNIEIFFITTSHPSEDLQKLSEKVEIRFIDINLKMPKEYKRSGINLVDYPELLRDFQDRKDPVAHQKKVYRPVNNKTMPNVNTYKTRCLVLTHKNINPEIVYIFVKSIFVNTIFLQDYPFGRLLKPRFMIYSPVKIPVHMGSVKYFFEEEFYSHQDLPLDQVKHFQLV